MPLSRLTAKKVNFQWGEKCEQSFQTLKQMLITSPILAFPDSDGEFILDVDASAYGLGGVLSQLQNGDERVIAYGSKTLSHTQHYYCTTKRELLALVHFLRHFRYYLLGRKFTVRTDHAPLKWLRNFKDADGMLARWLSVTECYDCVIEQRPGTKHRNADALSRLTCKRSDCLDCADSKQINNIQLNTLTERNGSSNTNHAPSNWADTWSHEDLCDFQNQDVAIGPIKLLMENHSEHRPPEI